MARAGAGDRGAAARQAKEERATTVLIVGGATVGLLSLVVIALVMTASAVQGLLLFEPTTGRATECYNVGLRGEGCTVAYTRDGVTRTTEIPGDAYSVGDHVAIRVDPGNPQRVRRGDFDGLVRVVAVDIIAATFVTVAVSGLLSSRRSRRRKPRCSVS